MINYLQSQIDMVKDRTDAIALADRPTVYFSPRGANKGFYDAKGNDFTRTVDFYEPLLIAGGINVAKDVEGNNVNVSPEQIVAWNPDVIFVAWGVTTNAETEKGVDFVMSAPELSEINAVKNGRVYPCIYPYARGTPIDKSILNLVYMAKCLYPDLFKDVIWKSTAMTFISI